MWDTIQALLRSEDIWRITYGELVIRLTLAVLLGGIIGMEREWNNHAAGFRTHILVCLGSATIMLLSIYGFSAFADEFNVRMDPARLAAQVVSGIGFLGAGAIMRNGNIVTGLTTAASIWVVAGIGLCVGAGFYIGALFCTFLVFICLLILNKWEKRWLEHRKMHDLEMVIIDRPGVLGVITQTLAELDIQINSLRMNPTDPPDDGMRTDRALMLMRLSMKLKGKLSSEKLVAAYERIADMDVVVSVDARHFVIQKRADGL